MTTINQLVRNPREAKKRKIKTPALKYNFNSLKQTYSFSNNPQKRAVFEQVKTKKPKKPNSAERAVGRVLLSNGKKFMVYIPGEKHNLQPYSVGLIGGGGAQDLPGVGYSVILGWKDGNAGGVKDRKQGRSLYGTKKNK